MKRKPFSWTTALKKLFSPMRRKPVRTRLSVESLSERIVPATHSYSPNASATDGATGSLRADITLANNDTTANATEQFKLTPGATYTLTLANPQTGHEQKNAAGDLNIQNLHGAGTKSYVFTGGTVNGVQTTIDQTAMDRVFEIIGTNVSVTFKNVTIEGGNAQDNGTPGTLPGLTPAFGGGILNEGASVTFNGASVVDNFADGASGLNGGNATNATKAGEIASSGGDGTTAGNAFGGGLYSTAGTITITNSTFSGDEAIGGQGGNGGNGGNASKSAAGSGGAGGFGGAGGNAIGGAVYLASGTVQVQGASSIANNLAIGGAGGAGGAGGKEGVKSSTNHGGHGGSGGAGGLAEAGGIYSAVGSISLTSGQIGANKVTGGAGGAGGAGGSGTAALNNGGIGGIGGNGGNANAGGLYAQLGNVTIKSISSISGNKVVAGAGGAGGAAGRGDAKNKTSGGTGGDGGAGGAGGSASGGGLYIANGNLLVDNTSTVSTNTASAGVGGDGGNGGNGKQHLGGNGGAGGAGGSAGGGGIYSALGSVIVADGSVVKANLAEANGGGTGGAGGSVATSNASAGIGGNGGNGGSSYGGGIYAKSGAITIEAVDPAAAANTTPPSKISGVYGNEATGHVNPTTKIAAVGNGGVGGKGAHKQTNAGAGGSGGTGESAFGGGIADAHGNVSVVSSTVGVKSTSVGATGSTSAATSGAMTANNKKANRAIAIAGGNGGIGGAGSVATAQGGNGGNGGFGSVAEGGGIYAVKGTVSISDSTIDYNVASGGAGGNGGNGGNAANEPPGIGGAGASTGIGGGGGIYAVAGQVVVNVTSKITSNKAIAGAGGNGGTGGTNEFDERNLGGGAGAGGNGEGGGIWSSAAAVTASGSVSTNVAKGGQGGLGGTGLFKSANGGVIGALGGTGGGFGGAGGNGQGGGIYSATGAITVISSDLKNQSEVDKNIAAGGAGGAAGNAASKGQPGGDGGSGQGGGIYSDLGNIDLTAAKIASNVVKGNRGGAGGTGNPEGGATTGTGTGTGITKTSTITANSGGGNGGNGGNAQGGGIYIAEGNITLIHTNVELNKATGSLSGGSGGGSFSTTGQFGGRGGDGGNGEGGGIYAASGAVSITISQSSVTSNSVGAAGASGPGGAGSKKNGLAGNALGGGLFTAANSTIQNSTIAYNTAVGQDANTVAEGGGLYVAPLAKGNVGGVSLENSTVAFNTSNDAGGGIVNDGTLTIASTLIAENNSTTSADADFLDEGTSTVTYSIVQTTSGNSVTATSTNHDIVGSTDSALALNPTLQLAANKTEYIGFTGQSVAAKAGINADNLTTDQIGTAGQGTVGTLGIDIGAIQSVSASTGTPILVTAGKNGYVEILNAKTHAIIQNFQPFAGYVGLVNVALGDVNADGVPDIIVAAKGSVKVYDGASASVAGVNFNVPTSWVHLAATRNPATPVIKQFTPFAGYAGVLNVAAGDVNGDGYADIIVGTGAGTQGRVAVVSGASLSSTSVSYLGSIISPFGTAFTGGVVVAGAASADGPANVVVGTQTKGDQVKIYSLTGTFYTQLGSTISAFGTLPATAQLQLTALDVDGSGIDDIAIGVLSSGVGRVQVIDQSDDILSTINVGGGLTAMAISAYNGTGSTGASQDDLIIGTIPAGPAQFHVLNPTTGANISSFNELTALTGGISLAGT